MTEKSTTHERRVDWDMNWPTPSLSIVLVEPEIPPNTGNIARLCAATGTPLHLVEPLGFTLTDGALRRAGLDYWGAVEVTRHTNWQEAETFFAGKRLFFFSTAGTTRYDKVSYQPGDVLVFGSESRGLPDELIKSCPRDRLVGIPMRTNNVRSLNLATSVGIALYEALRQIDLL